MKIVKILSLVALISLSVASISAKPQEDLIEAIKITDKDKKRTGEDIKMAAEAIRQGANVNQLTLGESPLGIAVKYRNLPMVKFLLSKGAQSNFDYKSVVATAAKARKEMGMPLSDYEMIFLLPTGGLTPLHYAATYGDLPIVMALVESGADVNALDNDQETPLVLAKRFKKQAVIDYLENQ